MCGIRRGFVHVAIRWYTLVLPASLAFSLLYTVAEGKKKKKRKSHSGRWGTLGSWEWGTAPRNMSFARLSIDMAKGQYAATLPWCLRGRCGESVPAQPPNRWAPSREASVRPTGPRDLYLRRRSKACPQQASGRFRTLLLGLPRAGDLPRSLRLDLRGRLILRSTEYVPTAESPTPEERRDPKNQRKDGSGAGRPCGIGIL